MAEPDGRWGSLFAELAGNVAAAAPHRPTPLSQDGLLALFKGDAVGRGVRLEPATMADMCGVEPAAKPSLEVIYDEV